VKVVHGSDWHGFPRHCPEADLYIFTGDMYPDYPERDRSGKPCRIDPERSREMQARYAKTFAEQGGMRRYLKSPDAPVVLVRGNHDWVDLAPLFDGCNVVHEFISNELVEVQGLKITGHRGIPYIDSSWSDEETQTDLKERYRAMPMADIYVTHYPPSGVLDSAGGAEYSSVSGAKTRSYESYGLEGLADFLLYRGDRALHVFGHIHECGGHVVKHGSVYFSNAACSVNEIDF
jgi:Icc-related predicted phosphoesterase